MSVADKLRSDYDFIHTLDAKLLPRGDTTTKGPLVRLLKPFDELFVDIKVLLYLIKFFDNFFSLQKCVWSKCNFFFVFEFLYGMPKNTFNYAQIWFVHEISIKITEEWTKNWLYDVNYLNCMIPKIEKAMHYFLIINLLLSCIMIP